MILISDDVEITPKIVTKTKTITENKVIKIWAFTNTNAKWLLTIGIIHTLYTGCAIVYTLDYLKYK